MVAHHAVELGAGVGLVLQPELGLPGAGALWAGVVAGDLLLLAPDGSRAHRARAAAAGVALAGVATHYLLWPWEVRRGVPRLRGAEGLSRRQLPWYEAVLLEWAVAAVGSLVADVDPGHRRWALVGVAAAGPLALSARHHFRWVTEQARLRPRWWNRAVQAGR